MDGAAKRRKAKPRGSYFSITTSETSYSGNGALQANSANGAEGERVPSIDDFYLISLATMME
jgi:hypothetical protein